MTVDAAETGVTPSLVATGNYETTNTQSFEAAVRAGMTVVDIGAHVGYFSLLAARRVGASGSVFAFEPESHNRELLTRNVLANGYVDRISILPWAVSDHLGTAGLVTDRSNTGAPSLVAANVPDPFGSSSVPTVTLDGFTALLASNGDIDILKIDAQGWEGHVLAGARRLFAEHRIRKIFIEVWPEGLRRAGENPIEVLERLTAAGFRLDRVDEQQGSLLATDSREVVALCDSQGHFGAHMNLVATCEVPALGAAI